jgi:molecular chaperone GrpE
MQTQMPSRVPKWPFFAGDGLFIGAAYFIYLQTRFPMGAWQLFFIVLCAAGGAVLAIMPFLLEYRLLLKLAEAQTLTSVTSQLKNLEQIAKQIGSATGQWYTVQESADKTAAQVQQISDKMSAELHAFTEFMQRSNESEKANLRLEIDKLRRGESEWVQVLVRILDHVHALHAGAVRSGQARLIEQIAGFQAACHDSVRRVGLAPFAARPEEPFDPQRHQLVDVEARPASGATVSETIAAGYNLQGKLLRPALVRLQEQPATGSKAKPGKSEPDKDQSQLPLEVAGAGG